MFRGQDDATTPHLPHQLPDRYPYLGLLQHSDGYCQVKQFGGILAARRHR